MQKKCHLSNNLVWIDQLPLQRTLLKKQADAVDDLARTPSVLYNSRRGRARLLQIGLLAGQPAQASVGVHDGCRNRLIDLMREGGSHLSHAAHPARTCEIGRRLPQVSLR